MDLPRNNFTPNYKVSMNIKYPIRIAAATVVLALAGCVQPLKKLDAPMAEQEKADHVVIFMMQSEVAVDDAQSSNYGGGLIGALIEVAVESTMTKNRQKALEPLRDKLLDYEFESKLISGIEANLPTSLVKQGAPVKIVRNEEEWRAHLQTVIPANVLLISPRYAFEQNFEIAYVHSTALMQTFKQMPPTPKQWKQMGKAARKAAEPVLLHAGSYYSQHVPYSPFERQKKQKGESGYERNARAWSDNGAEPVRVAFAAGIDELADLIQRDGERRLPSIEGKKKARVFLAHAIVQPMQLKAVPIDSEGSRTLVVFGQNVHWIDNRQMKK